MQPKIVKLINAMCEYDQGDPQRIQHFLKVHELSCLIAATEQLDADTLLILESAAILHDIGIHISEQKYGSSNGHYQQLEGPAEAHKLLSLQKDDFTQDQVERICYLIAHHHIFKDIQGLDYQILVEADFLVNILEDQLPAQAVEKLKAELFKTSMGKQLLSYMYDTVYKPK